VIVVRYADDFIVGFQHRKEAERFLEELRDRFKGFGLELHPEKTRLIEFGGFAAQARKDRGEGKPETFNFLGFTHICGETLRGGFTVLRRTMRDRWQAKLKKVGEQLRRRMHQSIPEQGAYLRSVLLGHFRYYGVPRNRASITVFRKQVSWRWHQMLKRRSQKHRLPWERMQRLIARWLPLACVCQPHPFVRLGVIT
jgi:hypothetical protein